jgi:hypothetical protein
MAIEWPITILKPRSIVPPFLASRSLSGGASLSGRMQIVASDAGVWMCSLNNIPLYNRQTILTWRAIAARAEGRLNPIDLPLFRYELEYSAQGADYDYGAPVTSIPFSDETYFDDGTGFVGSITEVAADGAAALRATSMTFSVTTAPRIEPGQIFGINHATKGPRWYQIKTYDYDTFAVTFQPPLREAVADGEVIIFDQPACRMRLATDNEMQIELEAGSYGSESVNFIEDL